MPSHKVEGCRALSVEKGAFMFIYLVENTQFVDWDSFDSFVCIAKNEEAARATPPGGDYYGDEGKDAWKDARVTCIGQAHSGISSSVICAKYTGS